MWWVRAHASAQICASLRVFADILPPMTTIASTRAASSAAAACRADVASQMVSITRTSSVRPKRRLTSSARRARDCVV